MYDPKSKDANEFICHEEVEASIAEAKAQANDPAVVKQIA